MQIGYKRLTHGTGDAFLTLMKMSGLRFVIICYRYLRLDQLSLKRLKSAKWLLQVGRESLNSLMINFFCYSKRTIVISVDDTIYDYGDL